MNNGFVKIHRKLLDNPIVCKDAEYFTVWVYLLLVATHKSCSAIFNGKKIELQPGQIITGRKTIAERFNISESKVQRILKSFELEQQIKQQTGNKNRLITIIKWSDYQQSEQQTEQQVNNNRTTTEQQVNTYKNERMKECKNILSADADIVSETDTMQSCPYQKIKDLYHSICISFPKIRAISGSRQKAVAARWRTYKNLDVFKELFTVAENSSFLKGANNNNWSADFDWMMKPNNFSKILEHKYDDQTGKGENFGKLKDDTIQNYGFTV